VLKVAATAVFISLTVEMAQYVLSLGRVSSIDDVLLNTVGGVMGCLLVRRWWRGTASRGHMRAQVTSRA
jgi:glycopeptide antibiotics resistance protein